MYLYLSALLFCKLYLTLYTFKVVILKSLSEYKVKILYIVED